MVRSRDTEQLTVAKNVRKQIAQVLVTLKDTIKGADP